MIVILLISLALLLTATAIRPVRSTIGDFELRRRLDNKQKGALLEWRRSELYGELMAIRRVLVAFFLVVTSALAISMYGWVTGLISSFVLILVYNRLATLPPIQRYVQRAYAKYEPSVLKTLERHQGVIRPLRGSAEEPMVQAIASPEELVHIVSESGQLLTADEKKMIQGVVEFSEKLVKDYMTPRSMMEAIGVNELLGPLVLDGLYKTGHSHFPVFEGDIDHIVGMLHLHSVSMVSSKQSQAVREAMESRVLYIHEDQTLSDALSACIKHRRHLLIVINEFRETVGVVTIEDAVEQLIGQKIVDSNDRHDDLRAVAARNPRGNNHPAKSVDV